MDRQSCETLYPPPEFIDQIAPLCALSFSHCSTPIRYRPLRNINLESGFIHIPHPKEGSKKQGKFAYLDIEFISKQWWRRRESNPRPKTFHSSLYILIPDTEFHAINLLRAGILAALAC